MINTKKAFLKVSDQNKFCKNCGLVEHPLFPKFNHDVCFLCENWDEAPDYKTSRQELRKLLVKHMEMCREHQAPSKWLIGVSGGTGSSAGVAYLKLLREEIEQEYSDIAGEHSVPIQIIAFTFKNPFYRDEAKQNVQILVDAAEAEWLFDEPEDADFRAGLKAFGLDLRSSHPCHFCNFYGYSRISTVADSYFKADGIMPVIFNLWDKRREWQPYISEFNFKTAFAVATENDILQPFIDAEKINPAITAYFKGDLRTGTTDIYADKLNILSLPQYDDFSDSKCDELLRPYFDSGFRILPRHFDCGFNIVKDILSAVSGINQKIFILSAAVRDGEAKRKEVMAYYEKINEFTSDIPQEAYDRANDICTELNDLWDAKVAYFENQMKK